MRHSSRFILSIFIIILGIAIAAIVMISIVAGRIDRTQRELLIVQAKQASLLVTPTDIASLSGSSADISNPLYQRLKSQLTAFREANPDIRFVYVMGYHPEIRTQFFYVDSEPENSNDYSPPGQLFPDTRPEDIEQYLAGEPYTDGAYQDSWGQWVSGYVPMKDPAGSVIAMVGIDIATDVWKEQLLFIRTTVGIIALLLAIIAIAVASRIYRRDRSISNLSLQNQKLEKKQSSLKQLQQLAHLGSVAIHFPDKTVQFDEAFSGIFSGGENGRIGFAALLSIVHADDQAKLSEMMSEIETSTNVYAWVDVRIGTKENGYRKYHLYGNVTRHAAGTPERFDGIMQDITDIER